MVSETPAGQSPRTHDDEQDNSRWQAVPGAPGLFRAEIVKADGRRLTSYRRRTADSA
jgi:hypothetical protein